MKKRYVLIDYENVQPEAIEALVREDCHVLVFVGANQTKVTYEIASVLQRMGERASYIKIAGNGNNALDFHIAYFIGKLAAKEPEAFFHIVSKDTGFDPLIQHLKSEKLMVDRVSLIAELPFHKKAHHQAETGSDYVAAITANLVQRGAARPQTVKTLTSTINAHFYKSLNTAEITNIIEALKKKGFVTVNGTKVTYSLPGGN